MKYKEIVYMILDKIKSVSDDAFFTEDHVLFLINKYRSFILKQQYSNIKKFIPESNYQTICLDLIEVPAIPTLLCEGTMLKSKQQIPYIMKIGTTTIYPVNYYLGEITYVTKDRMRYVGSNKFMQNIIYASLGPDQHLWLKSSNPQYLYLEKVRMTGIFEDTLEASKLSCDDSECDIFEMEFPFEASLVPQMLELVTQELLGAEYRPEDKLNNANDELSRYAAAGLQPQQQQQNDDSDRSQHE